MVCFPGCYLNSFPFDDHLVTDLALMGYRSFYIMNSVTSGNKSLRFFLLLPYIVVEMVAGLKRIIVATSIPVLDTALFLTRPGDSVVNMA